MMNAIFFYLTRLKARSYKDKLLKDLVFTLFTELSSSKLTENTRNLQQEMLNGNRVRLTQIRLSAVFHGSDVGENWRMFNNI